MLYLFLVGHHLPQCYAVLLMHYTSHPQNHNAITQVESAISQVESAITQVESAISQVESAITQVESAISQVERVQYLKWRECNNSSGECNISEVYISTEGEKVFVLWYN